MKKHTLLALALALAGSSFAAKSEKPEVDPVKICGRLGVMQIDPADLPEGVKPEDVRMCADHPLGWTNLFGYGDWLPNWLPF